MTAHIKAIGFAGLSHQVADVEPWGAAAFDGAHQFRYQQIGQQDVYRLPGPARSGRRWRSLRGPGKPAVVQDCSPTDNGAGCVTDIAFSFDPLAVFKFCPELHIDVGGRNHLTLHRQHAT